MTNTIQSRIHFLVLGITAVLACNAPVHALTWTGSVVYNDSGTLTGSFEYDPNTGGGTGYSNVNLTLTVGSSQPQTAGMVVNFDDSTIDPDQATNQNEIYVTKALNLYYNVPGTDPYEVTVFLGKGNQGWETAGTTQVSTSITEELQTEYSIAPEYEPLSQIVFATGANGSFSSNSAPVPFDCQFGAAIPALGSVLALSVMRRVKNIKKA